MSCSALACTASTSWPRAITALSHSWVRCSIRALARCTPALASSTTARRRASARRALASPIEMNSSTAR
ncbi:hypothetical protein [Nonomuraea jiangxiensis]|uniref:Uncharacterized protein n=1 Tax=Nonomuraea jiangxiensis TaxID=633440 RepID=A0A1G7YPI0_9ACTN|nr:hypothetical protein [Nonomuraea jiangxiensis]SDG98304.1 hypothetical protein SAMN05421869_101176 [Nonomuraea jiangxiensis]